MTSIITIFVVPFVLLREKFSSMIFSVISLLWKCYHYLNLVSVVTIIILPLSQLCRIWEVILTWRSEFRDELC